MEACNGRPPRSRSQRQRSSPLDLRHAAVDEELDASDVATFVRSEERNYLGNFVQGSRATEGYCAHHAVCILLDLSFRHAQGIAVARRRNHARTDGVHADFAVFEIRGEVRAKERTAAWPRYRR